MRRLEREREGDAWEENEKLKLKEEGPEVKVYKEGVSGSCRKVSQVCLKKKVPYLTVILLIH